MNVYTILLIIKRDILTGATVLAGFIGAFVKPALEMAHNTSEIKQGLVPSLIILTTTIFQKFMKK